ncbi:hypothetical protein GIB67_041546 [Kingdonia uniflora]|uniref:Uncharacterized protein n=1 Tax=Kingdonia uniflora TaxID=39325 RepID=A0A7J7MQ74_9MAGN|nr:hypothetical protein GIB67_041546 [Kingdonia uniflora]
MLKFKLRYFGDQPLEMPTPIPISPMYQVMSEEEAVEAEEYFYYMRRFYYILLKGIFINLTICLSGKDGPSVLFEGPPFLVVKLYERCMITCANYSEYWIRYVLFMEASRSMDLANNTIARATQVFAKRQPEIHLFAARFKEQNGDIPGSRAVYQLLHSRIFPRLLKSVIKHTNMEYRQGNKENAFSSYEQDIATKKAKEQSQMPMLFVQYSRFLYLDYRQKDPKVIVLDPPDAIQHVHNRQSMLQDVADLNISESHVLTSKELILVVDLKLSHNYIFHLEQLSISSYGAAKHFEFTVQDVLTMYRKITGKEYASTNQVTEKQMPVYQLLSKILYHVIDIQLKAEADTDKLFAQVTLLLESNVEHEEFCVESHLIFRVVVDMETSPILEASTSGRSAEEFCKAKALVVGRWGNFIKYTGKQFISCMVGFGEEHFFFLADLEKEKLDRGLDKLISLEYYYGNVQGDLEEVFMCYLFQLEYGLSLSLNNLAKGIMNIIGACPIQLNENMWEVINIYEFWDKLWKENEVEMRISPEDIL